MKTLTLATFLAGLAFACEAKTIALWPLGDNAAPESASVCARCATDPGFDLSVNAAAVDAATPDGWNLPPNPCADLADPYPAIVRNSLKSSADGGINCGVAFVSNARLAQYTYPTNDFTVEGWLRFDAFDTAVGTWRIIVQAGNGSGGNGGWCLSMRRDATSGFFYLNMFSENMNKSPYPSTGDKAFYNFIDGKTPVSWADLEGSWHHYAIVFDYRNPDNDSQSRWRLYFDGRLAGTVTQDRFAEGYVISPVNPRMDFGGRQDSAGQRLKGAYSQWRVSDAALGPGDFLNFTDGGTKTGAKVADVQPTWTALDLNTRDIANHRWVNTGVRLTGAAVSNCTFETWILGAGDSQIMSQFSGDRYRSNWRLEKWAASAGGDDFRHLVFQIYDPVAQTWIYFRSVRTISENAWHHVALVIDLDVFRFYIDGVFDSEESHPGVHLATDTSNCDGVVIGNQRLWATPYGPNGNAQASFAEARVWNRARTGDEIRANLRHRLASPEGEPDLVGYWPLCDGVAGDYADGLVAYNYARLDAEANGFWQREVGNQGYTSIRGFVTNGLWKSYSNLAITGAAPRAVTAAFCPEGAYTNAATTGVTEPYSHFTYTAWYFFSAKSTGYGERPLVSKAYAGNGRMHLRERRGGELYLWLGGGDNGATNEELVVSAADAGIHYGRWTHLALVRDGRTFSIYIDGVLKGESAAFTLPTHPTAAFQFGGFFAGGSSGIFNGLVREVGLWKTALTPDQIVETMTRRPLGTEHKLLGYWPCDDEGGNALRNLKSGGSPATPVGGSGAAFVWRPLASVPAIDGNLDIPIPGLLMLIR